MGTVYIDRKGIHVKLDGNALAFYANGEREGMVPITPLKRVVVVGNITIETPALNRLADENISVVFLSGRRARFHGMLHGRLHNNGILRLRQYEKTLPLNPPAPPFIPVPKRVCSGKGGQEGISQFSVEFSRDIVSRKVNAQLSLLNDARPQRPDLRYPLTAAITTLTRILAKLEINDSTLDTQDLSLDSIRGYEGSAASAYFSAYTTLFPESLNFKKRNRRPPEDPVNAMLSLCYTLLHYEIVREIEVAGLDPTIGFYHQFEYGRESLACDLVEIFRPETDKFVWTIFRERLFTVRDFSHEGERPGCYLQKGGRQRFYPLYEEWAKTMRPLFVEEVRLLAKEIMGEESGVYYGQNTLSE